MKLSIALALLFSMTVVFSANSAIAKESNNRLVENWCLEFMNSFSNLKCGNKIKLGDPTLFRDIFNKYNLTVELYNNNFINNREYIGMGATTGKFYPPEALARNMGQAETLQKSLLAIKIPDGKGPNLTTWHETVHAIIYIHRLRETMLANDTEDGVIEESYTWLLEDRVKWLNQYVKPYDEFYRKAEKEIPSASIEKVIELSSKLKKKKDMLTAKWKEWHLDGPGNNDQNKKAPVMSKSLVKEFDKELGVNVNLYSIMSCYPQLFTPLSSVKHDGMIFSANGVKIQKQIQPLYCNPQNIKVSVKAHLTDRISKMNPNKQNPYSFRNGTNTYSIVGEDYSWKIASIPAQNIQLITSRSSGKAAAANVNQDRATFTWLSKPPGQVRLNVTCKRTWRIASNQGVQSETTQGSGYIWLNCFPK